MTTVTKVTGQRGGSNYLHSEGGEQTKEIDNVQYDKDRTFRGNHAQYRLFGADSGQRCLQRGGRRDRHGVL